MLLNYHQLEKDGIDCKRSESGDVCGIGSQHTRHTRLWNRSG